MSPLGLPITETARHTPGPWFSNDMGLHNGIGDGIAAYAADCYPNDDDAGLITAAPDLLAALKVAEATIERLAPSGSRATQGTRDVIDAAIAKAGGR